MALGAMAANKDLRVRIVPVGLSYFHAHKFRSRVVVEFGHAMDVDEALVELYKKGGAEKREAVGKLLGVIYDALKTVTIRAPDYETLQVSSRLNTIETRIHHIEFRSYKLQDDYMSHPVNTSVSDRLSSSTNAS